MAVVVNKVAREVEKLRVAHNGEWVSCEFSRYRADGSLALTLYTPEGESYAKASVCLQDAARITAPNESLILNPDQLYIKSYSENEGIYQSLVASGIILPEREQVRVNRYFGPIVDLCTLTPNVYSLIQKAGI